MEGISQEIAHRFLVVNPIRFMAMSWIVNIEMVCYKLLLRRWNGGRKEWAGKSHQQHNQKPDMWSSKCKQLWQPVCRIGFVDGVRPGGKFRKLLASVRPFSSHFLRNRRQSLPCHFFKSINLHDKRASSTSQAPQVL